MTRGVSSAMPHDRHPIRSTIRFSEDQAAEPGAALRSAMANWATGVAVMAVRHGSRVESITINSFISISLDPPTILVSLGEQAAILHALAATNRFSVSVLAEDQTRIAAMVADRLPTAQQLFAGDPDPVLTDALVTLVCTTSQTHRAGDHILYLGAVERVIPGRDASPLLYYRGAYHKSSR